MKGKVRSWIAGIVVLAAGAAAGCVWFILSHPPPAPPWQGVLLMKGWGPTPIKGGFWRQMVTCHVQSGQLASWCPFSSCQHYSLSETFRYAVLAKELVFVDLYSQGGPTVVAVDALSGSSREVARLPIGTKEKEYGLDLRVSATGRELLVIVHGGFGRSWFAAYSGSDGHQLWRKDGIIKDADWAADGSALLVVKEKSRGCWIVELGRDGEETGRRWQGRLARWSPDRSRLLVLRGEQLLILEVASGRRCGSSSVEAAMDACWNEDGTVVAVVCSNRGIRNKDGAVVLVGNVNGEGFHQVSELGGYRGGIVWTASAPPISLKQHEEPD